MIGKAGGEDLRFIFKAAESAGVDDAVAIALEFVAVGMRKFGITPSARAFERKAQTGERGIIFPRRRPVHCC